MLNKIGLTKKLFIITTVIFVAFISGTLVTQSLFFERVYINKKKNDLEINIQKFKASYNSTENNEKVAELIQEYEDNYNFKIVIRDKNGNLKYITKFGGDRLDPIKNRDLSQYIMAWSKNPDNLIQAKLRNKPVTETSESNNQMGRSLISSLLSNDKNEMIFVLASLQPVNEAANVINELYLYFYLVAIFLIIILSFLYSNMIAKPLIKINKTASRMAKLDFSEKCLVYSKDEIGNVASSLNFLSENLNNALVSLRSANVKLEEDIEKERNLEKMRKEFVASVSHELKTPISLIDGYAVGLKDNIFEGEDKDFYLDIIIDETRKMASLVTDMLDISQLESDTFKLSMEDFNLTELVRFTLKKYIALANEKSVTIEFKLLENVEINADWNRMEQVITNYVTNALRHVNEGGKITISLIDEGENISLEIENTGSSIPEEDMLKVWDKFYKIDKSRNRKSGGTGIGLSIVKNILMLHNYSFGVENTDVGVKCFFKVPNKDFNKQ